LYFTTTAKDLSIGNKKKGGKAMKTATMTDEQRKELCRTDPKYEEYFGGIMEHIKNNHRGPTNEQMAELYQAIATAMDKPGMNEPIYYLGDRTLADCFGEQYIIELVDLPERIDGHYRHEEKRPDQVMINLNWWPTMTLDRRVQVILHEIAHFDLSYDDSVCDSYDCAGVDELEYKAQIRGQRLFNGNRFNVEAQNE